MGSAKPGAQAPDFTLPDMEGTPRPLQEWLARGPVLAVFFKVSCPTCQYTLPFLGRLHQRLQGKAAVIGISQDVRRKTEQFNREYGVGFPVLLDSEDANYPVSNAYGITHVPTLFLIDPDGRISSSSTGFVRAELEEIARRLGPVPLFHRDEKVEAFRAG
jgi:peroxiredoxin